jgi:hypothetical protein
MRLVTVVRITKDGVSGEIASGSEVSEGYSEQQLACRVIKQFRAAKSELIAGLTAKKAVESLQQDLFPEESPAAF